MNKNDDVNDDFENGEPDIDTDFGEFDQENGKRSFASVIKENQAVKIGLVVGALVIVIGAIMLFGGPDVKGPNSNVTSGNDLKEPPGTNDLSPAMKQVIEEANQQKLDEALQQGTSVIPQPTETPQQQLTVPSDEATAEDPLARWRDIQNERLQAQQTGQTAAQAQPVADPAREQILQGLTSAMTAQMTEILSGKKIDNLKSMQITSLEQILAARQRNATQQQAQQVATATAAQQAGIDPLTGKPLVPAKILLPAGAIEYAQLLIEANSDIQGPIVSMIVSGPFAGSRALGTFTRQEKYLVLQFKTLVNKKGISIPIDAYALDPDTTLTGMATDVDNRYLQRIILPAAAEFVQGMGQAYSEQQGQTTIVTGDVVVQSQPPLNTKEQIGKGVERAADRVGEVLEEEGDNIQPLVRVRAGTPMGILFMSPVTDQDLVAGLNSPTTARTLQQQQQQTLLQQQLGQQGTNANQNPLYLIQSLQGSQNLQAGQTGTTGLYGTSGANGTNGTVNNFNSNQNGNDSGQNSNIFSTQDYLSRQ